MNMKNKMKVTMAGSPVVNRRTVIRAAAGAAAALFCGGGALAGGSDRETEDKVHCEWLAKIIKQINTIKVGMSRSDVGKFLVEDVAGFTLSSHRDRLGSVSTSTHAASVDTTFNGIPAARSIAVNRT
jgi:hypothetical protein